MDNASLDMMLQHIRSFVAGREQCGRTDGELLGAFLHSGQQQAFKEIVRRHGAMVLGVCRRYLGNWFDAEDAFQATFLLLLRRAPSISSTDSIASWLHGAARRVAADARRAATRRRDHERQAPAGRSASPADQAALREVCLVLEEEIDRLPALYREPFVLCCLEHLSRAEVGARLNVNEPTVRIRLNRARKMLRERLTRRGVTLNASLAAVALVTGADGASVPAALLASTLSAAAHLAAGGTLSTGPVPAAVVALIAGGKRAMFSALMKLVAVAALALGAAILAVAAHQGSNKPDSPKRPPLPAAALPAEAQKNEPAAKRRGDPPPVAAAKPAVARTLRVVVLDPQGKPLQGAKIHASIWTNEKGFKANHDYQTDAAGAAQVELPKTYYILRLWASKKPFASLFANWDQNELASGAKLPAEYTFRLEPAVSAGGRIVDEQGKPIAGTRVQVMITNDPKPARGDGRARYDTWLAERNDAAKTDTEGRWRIDNVPSHPRVDLSLLVSHPEYVSHGNWGEAQKAAGITTAMLRKGTATLTLRRGVIVRGRVTDPAGKPIKNALVVEGNNPYKSWLPRKFPTDADGRFRLPAQAPEETTLTVIAAGWAPQMRRIKLRADLPPQDFRLAPGKPILLRIVDAAGRPVPRAYVYILEWKGSKSLYGDHNPNHPRVPDDGVPRRAKENGVWQWDSAPDDPVKLRISMAGFAKRELEVAGGAAERTVVLKADHRITGRVTDAVTGKPIPTFTVIPLDVFRKDWLVAERFNAVPGKDGRLDYLATRTDIPLRLRIEAPGYRTQDGPEFRVCDSTSRTQHFRLRPSEPVAGVVLDSAGKPVANAEVLLATPTEVARLGTNRSNHKTFTSEAGRFTFPDPGEPFLVVTQSDAGFALAEFPAGRHDAGTLRLRPWASIRGQFRDGGRPVRGATVCLNPIRLDSLDRPRIDTVMMQVVTDADGRFEFPRVPPIPINLRVGLGPWKDEGFRSGPSVPLDLNPGQRVELDLGSGGTVVKGKVKLIGKVPADLDCTYSLNYLVQRAEGIAPPPDVARLGFDARKGWRDIWSKTIEGQTYLGILRHWFVKLAADGTFRVSGVPAGDYDLAVEVYAKPSGCLVDPVARKVVRVTVKAEDAARGELVLPEIAAQVIPVPAVGDSPSLAFRHADGTGGALKDYRGKYTLVHFWASWCGPCKKQLPTIRRLHERYAARGLATLGLSLDHHSEAWQAALKRLELPWRQGRLADASEAEISSVPVYWLLDPTGKIVAKVYDLDELAKALTEYMK
jgi:RNA polymerase sigma factor (sigma-70 family)